MEKKKEIQEFSDADFFELIKDDTKAIAYYKKELIKLLTRKIYPKDQYGYMFIRILSEKKKR